MPSSAPGAVPGEGRANHCLGEIRPVILGVALAAQTIVTIFVLDLKINFEVGHGAVAPLLQPDSVLREKVAARVSGPGRK